jgi:hypothetical protein
MKRFIVISLFFILVIIALSSVGRREITVFKANYNDNEYSAVKMVEGFKGTFMQWWLMKEWDDNAWREEFKALTELGMEYIVLTPTAFLTRLNNTYHTYTVYPTEIEGFMTITDHKGDTYPDVVDICLRNASEYGIKVFLGLNFGDDWWSNRGKETWMIDRVTEGNLVASELWEKYRDKYPDSFYGWYWAWEVDNFYFRTFLDLSKSKFALTRAIKLQLDYLEEKNMRLPFMTAPFMDARLGTPKGFARLWEYVLNNAGFTEGDVLCLQDSVCAGGVKEEDMAKWFAAMKAAVDTIPGMRLWADMETFDIHDWTAIGLDVLIRRMEAIAGIVDGYMTFSYTHYYSPNVTADGFHRSLVDYTKNGVLEKVSPAPPVNFSAEFDGQNVRLRWDSGDDNMGVFGYYLYRDGKLVTVLKEGTRGSASASRDLEKEYIDFDIADGQEYAYELSCFDFAGNVSDKVQVVLRTETPAK